MVDAIIAKFAATSDTLQETASSKKWATFLEQLKAAGKCLEGNDRLNELILSSEQSFKAAARQEDLNALTSAVAAITSLPTDGDLSAGMQKDLVAAWTRVQERGVDDLEAVLLERLSRAVEIFIDLVLEMVAAEFGGEQNAEKPTEQLQSLPAFLDATCLISKVCVKGSITTLRDSFSV